MVFFWLSAFAQAPVAVAGVLSEVECGACEERGGIHTDKVSFL